MAQMMTMIADPAAQYDDEHENHQTHLIVSTNMIVMIMMITLILIVKTKEIKRAEQTLLSFE